MGTSEAGVLAGELEAIAAAAAARLRAETEKNDEQAAEAQQTVIAAAGRAMATGVSLGEIAAAEQAGQARVRGELGKELLRTIERTTRRDARSTTSTNRRAAAADGLVSPTASWRAPPAPRRAPSARCSPAQATTQTRPLPDRSPPRRR